MDPASVEAIVQGVVAVAIAVITSIVAPLLLKQLKVADKKVADQDRQVLYPVLVTAIAYAQAIIQKDEAAKVENIETLQNKIVDLAKHYIRLQIGDTIDALEIDDAALHRMLLARLQQAVAYARAHIPGISDNQAALVGQPSTPPGV